MEIDNRGEGVPRRRPGSFFLDRSQFAHADMRVAVDEARQKRTPGDVDDVIAVEVAAQLDDPASLDRNVNSRGICAGAVEDDAAVEDCPCHDLPSSRWTRFRAW